MKNKKILGALALILIIALIGFFVMRARNPKIVKSQGAPEITAEEILAERAHQASKLLDTPLGKAFSSRNWPEIAKLYRPESDFIKLGEIIRSLYINQQIKDYTADDQHKLMALVLSTFQTMPEKNFHLSGMLSSQFERLPAPAHTDDNFKILKEWATDEKEAPLMRKMGLIKLVLHDAKPDPDLVSLYQKTLFGGDVLGQTHIEWVQRIDEVRNVSVQEAILQNLIKNFKKVPDIAQASALIVMAHHIDLKPQEVKTLTMKFLHSEDQGRFEAALKALPPLINGKWLKQAEKDEVVKTLTAASDRIKTPFVDLKSKEILGLLEHT